MAKKEGPKPGHNGYDPEKAKQVIDACETLQQEIADLKADNASKCKDKHAEIKDIIDDAKKSYGIPKIVTQRVLKIHKLEDRARRARDDLSPENQDGVDQLRHALGDLADTPLGQAAQ